MLRLVDNGAALPRRVSPVGDSAPRSVLRAQPGSIRAQPGAQLRAQPATVLRPALSIAPEHARRRTESDHATRLARAAIERETRLASGMAADDARWVFARRVAENLDGGKAAILTPEKRRRLLATARRVGLRDFDASLVIALVQDGRRSGHGALNPQVEQSLTMIAPAAKAREGAGDALRFMIAAAILGAMMLWVMIRWLPLS